MKVFMGPYQDDADREIEVEIHDYDVWGMDHSLAFIILPMLERLKDDKQGAPNVDQEDVPEALRWTPEEAEAYSKHGQTDENFFKRWDYVLDEMIFAFKHYNEDWESQFQTGEIDRVHVKLDEQYENPETGELEDLYAWEKGPNHTFEIDWDARNAFGERIQRGCALFGKYYSSLWS